MSGQAAGIDPEVVELATRVFDPAWADDRGQTPPATAGADPDAGCPSARQTAAFFGLPEMTALLEERDR